MTSRLLRILHFSTWTALSVCAAALLFLATTIPNVMQPGEKSARDKNVEEIRASTDLHEVQQIAIWRTKEEGYLAQSTRMLMIISVGALLISMICSSVSLAQIRRLKNKPWKKETG